MTLPLLAFTDVSGGYGTAAVVRAVSGVLNAGEVLCVLGRNGVGKSTLTKLLFGHLPCWTGDIMLAGVRVKGLGPSERRKRGMTYCSQERPVFDELTVRDNLTLMQPTGSVSAFEPYFERFPILERRLNQHAGSLSGGEKKILSLTRGLAETHDVVILDEPSEGVQWENIIHMAALIEEQKQRGVAFIVVEQNLAFAERIADRYLVMDQGRSVLVGDRGAVDREAILSHLHV